MLGTREERQALVERMKRSAEMMPANEWNMNRHGPHVGPMRPGPGVRVQAALRLADKETLTPAEQQEWDEACFLVFGNRMRSF